MFFTKQPLIQLSLLALIGFTIAGHCSDFLVFNAVVEEPEPRFAVTVLNTHTKSIERKMDGLVCRARNGLYAVLNTASLEPSILICDSNLNVLHEHLTTSETGFFELVSNRAIVYLDGSNLVYYDWQSLSKTILDSNTVQEISPAVSGDQNTVAYLAYSSGTQKQKPYLLKAFSLQAGSASIIYDSATCDTENITTKLEWHDSDSLVLFGKYMGPNTNLALALTNAYDGSVKTLYHKPDVTPFYASFGPGRRKVIFSAFTQNKSVSTICTMDTSGACHSLLASSGADRKLCVGFFRDEQHSLVIDFDEPITSMHLGTIGVLNHTDLSIDTLANTMLVMRPWYFQSNHNPNPSVGAIATQPSLALRRNVGIRLAIQHSQSSVNFGVRVIDPGDFILRVFDSSGKRVWWHTKSRAGPGSYHVEWPYRNRLHPSTHNGIYILQAEQNGKQIAMRFRIAR